MLLPEYFGELALGGPGQKRGATVMSTSSNTEVLVLPRDAFEETVSANAAVAKKLREEKDRYRETQMQLLGRTISSSPPGSPKRCADRFAAACAVCSVCDLMLLAVLC